MQRFDETVQFLRKPYDFIAEGCAHRDSDVFETRLMLRPTICMRGREAAQIFYDEDRFLRHGAAPLRIQQSLLGHGGIQELDGDRHRHRKRMFLHITHPERVEVLLERCHHQWVRAIQRWTRRPEIVLYDEMHELLTRAVCDWAGVPLHEDEIPRRVHELTAMFDNAGNVGPAHWKARMARGRAERWLAGIVDDLRHARLIAPRHSALCTVAWHCGLDGQLLDEHTAAVELLNVLRPTVAVSVFIVFAAVALHRFPAARAGIANGNIALLDRFVSEVRRFYPFFPAAMARARRDFEWHGQRFRRGMRVLLDLHGTNHDARSWDSPDEFRPDRFACPASESFDFIPQGGGTYHDHHRCPGEGITVELMKQSVWFLVNRVHYTLPPQDLQIDRSRLPALPRSHVVMRDMTAIHP